jgi:glycine betaine/choline ABC-type transport system substrate-binding protein
MKRLSAFALLIAVLVLAACGSDDDNSSTSSSGGGDTSSSSADSKTITKDAANAGKTVTIGSKNFTEEFILGQIYAQALKAAGYTVKTELNLGSEQIALKAVKSGQVDAYPEYTGTALTSFFKLKSEDVPKDEQKAYVLARTGFAKQGLTALAPTPFTDSNGVGMLKQTADKLGVSSISDLKDKASTLRFSGTPECPQRPDCLLGLKDVYGLKFKKVIPVDPALRYSVLEKKKADVGIVFTTDGQLAQGKVKLIEDDMHMFPPYNVTLVFKKDALDKLGASARKTIALVQQGLTTEAMQELNSRVDIDKQTPAAVAKAYLTESGYIK